MKTTATENLREMVGRIFDEESEWAHNEAWRNCPGEFDTETEAAYVEADKELTEVVRQLLKGKADYCVPSETFWGRIVQVLSFKSFATYQVQVLSDGVTDKQLAANKSAIKKGNLAALKPFTKTETKFVSHMGGAYAKQKQIFGNLAYAFFVLAHLAKHYGSREAGEKFLRVASVSQKHARAMPIRFEEGQLDELIATAQDGIDALKVAADYAALPDWEAFRKSEAAKFAAEERRVAAQEAKA